MKNLKFICLCLVFTIISCDGDSDSPSLVNQNSVATRIYLNSLKETISSFNQNTNNPLELCFTPSFPIDVFFNNGNKVTINSMNGLIEAMYSETQALHITSISLPFNIINKSSDELTIQNEEQFFDLLDSCASINTLDQLLGSENCFEYIFPLAVKNNSGDTLLISNGISLNNLLSEMEENEYWTDFVYPFQINYGGSNVEINSIWDFYNYLDCSPQLDCECTEEFIPVCVQTPNAIIQFENSCKAQCAGFNQDDFVSCN